MMKKITTLVLLALAISSCKNVEEKTEEISDNLEIEVAATEVKASYKHSLAQWSLNKPVFAGTKDPKDFALDAKAMGFEGLEYVTQLYPSVRDLGPDYGERVMKLANELNVISNNAGMTNVLIMVDRAGDLADPDPEKVKEAIANHKVWIDAAQLMGAHSVRANLFGELDPVKWHQISVAALKELGTYAKPKGVSVIIENHGGWSSDSAKLVAVMKEVDMGNIGVLPDFGNFCIEREGGERWGAACIKEYDMYKGTEEMMPYAKGVSAKSYAFDANGNETKIDYVKMMQIVKDSGFSGFIGTEFEGEGDDPTYGILATKALVSKALEQAK